MMKNFTQFFYEIDRSRKHLQATVFLLFIFSLLGTQEVWAQDCGFTANIEATQEAVCSGTGTSIAFSGGPAGGIVTYNIDGGANLTVTLNEGGAANIDTAPSLTTAVTYNLVSVTDGTCTQTLSGSTTVSVRAYPTASISADFNSVCYNSGTTIRFEGTPNAVVDYTTTVGSNAPVASTITLGADGKGSFSTGSLTADVTYSLVSAAYADIPHCEQQLTGAASVGVRSQLSTSIQATQEAVCSGTGTSIAFSGGPAGGIVTYNIDGGANLTVTLNEGGAANIDTAPSLTTAVTYNLVSVTDGTCTQTLSGSTTVSVRAYPTASISADFNSVCYNSGTTIRFEGTPNAVVDYTTTVGSNAPVASTITLGADGKGSFSTGSLTADVTYSLVSAAYADIPHCEQQLTGAVSVGVILLTANAGDNQEQCYNPNGNTFELTGSGTNGTPYWDVVATNANDLIVQIRNRNTFNPTVEISNGSSTSPRSVTLRLKVTSNATPSCGTVTDDVSLVIWPLPTASITNIKSIYLTGEPTVTLIGNPTPTTGSTFTITGVGSTSSTNLTGGTFTPCSFSPGDYVIRYTYIDAKGCTNFVDYPITIKQSTYSVINRATPFTICKGQITDFKAIVYRDVQVIYPYTESSFDVNIRDNATYNDAYTAYFVAQTGREPLPIEKTYPERLLQPIVINPDPSLSISQQLDVSKFVLSATLFNYQWIRNGSAQGETEEVISKAALSATDEIRVLVEPKTANSCISWSGPLISAKKIKKGMPSNYLFFSEPNYELTIPADTAPINICQGDNSVTITFPKGNFKWTKTNATIYWKLRRNTVEYTLQTINIPSDATPEQVDAFFQLTAAEIKAGLEAQSPAVSPTELIDGDEVYIDYISDIDRVVRTKCNKNAVLNRSDIVKVTVNKLVVNATEVLQTVCINGSYTFAADTTGTTGTAPLTYRWFVNNVEQTSATASTFVLGTPLTATAGDYVVNVTVSNGCQTQTASTVPVGTLTVRPDIAVQTLSGGGEYCELDPTAQSLWLASSQVGVEYILYRTTADGTPTEVERRSRTDGGRIDFTSQTAAGTYSVEANFTTAPTCGPIAMNRDGGVITVTQATELSGALEVWDVPGTESPAMWELRAVNIAPSTISGLTYKWYIGESIGGQPVSTWTQIAATSVPNTQVEATDNESIRYRVVVFGPEGECIRSLFLETTESFELLPVELLYLNAERRGENVQVQWATAKEQNNTGFEVQASTDGKVYRSLGFVAAKNNGNSSTKLVYTYIDTERDKAGTRYYRLKQIDVDNTAEFFGPVTVDFGSRNKVTVAPNPFREEIRLTLETEMEGSAYIVMTNAVGVQIIKRSITVEKGVNQKEIQLDSNLASGVYFITVRMGDLTKQFKLLKH